MTHSFICIIGLMYIYGFCILDIFGLGCRGYWQTWQERLARGIFGIICVLQCIAVCWSDAVCCCVLKCCSVLLCVGVFGNVWQIVVLCCSVWQCVVGCGSVSFCVAVWCSALQCVAVCCSVLQAYWKWFCIDRGMHATTHLLALMCAIPSNYVCEVTCFLLYT